jgi:hypothetical protein
MSPTSCRCSTPRHDADPCPDGGRRAGAGGARGGLASRGVAPPVLSGAAAGHDRVRDGTGWVRRALGHGPAPRPPAGRRPDTSASTSLPPAAGESPAAGALPGTAAVVGRNRTRCAGSAPTRRTPGSPVGPRRAGPLRFSSLARPAPRPRPAAGTGPGGALATPPSAIRTGRLRSVARRPPPAYRPGGLPGALPLLRVGRLVLGWDSRLDAFSGSPDRTWLPSGAGCPTTGPPAVRPARSSRTRASLPQSPTARGG